jgi:hypothetical protein
MTFSRKDIQHNKIAMILSVFMPQFTYCYAECRYAECRFTYCFAECRYAECRNLLIAMLNVFMLNVVMLNDIILIVVSFLTPVLFRHLWQLKTAVFMHRCLICFVLFHQFLN